MSPTWRPLAGDERGTSVIELGLVLPIMITMLLGIVDLSMGYAAKLKLEQAAQSTIEDVQQQGYAHSTTSLTAIEAEAEARAGTGSVATATAQLQCRNGAAKTNKIFTDTCSAGNDAARYVAVSIAQPFTPIFKLKTATVNTDGSYSLVGKAALRVQ